MKNQTAEKKPNILLIIADQQRYDTINKAGYDYMITPNLDRLAQEGCLYSNAHSHNPVCMPARHDLLTGQPAKGHGYFANCKQPIKNYSIPTLPRLFAENGYRTAAIGKMHFFPARMHHGYSEMQLMEEIPKKREDDEYAMFLKNNELGHIQNLHGVRPNIYHTPQNSQVKEEFHEITWVKQQTISWLKENNKKPFMLAVGYIKPHPPWDIPDRFKGIYNQAQLKDPIQISRNFPNSSEINEWNGDMDTDLEKRKIREAYYTSVTMVDDSVGDILNHLRESGEIDNTLIIYTSDHGEMLQDKGYYSKQLPYDSSVRVPFIVRYPKSFKPNTINTDFVDLLDIMPTCLDIAGIEHPTNNIYGSSLSSPKKSKDRSTIISACGFLGASRWVMCRNKEFKYIYNYNNSTEEFYDMINNPTETDNIIDKMKDTPLYKMFKLKVLEYEKKWGPEGAVVNKELITIPKEQFHGTIKGKYHLWSNNQFQRFSNGNSDEKRAEFNKEMEYALSDIDHSGVALKDVFNNKEWKDHLNSELNKFCNE